MPRRVTPFVGGIVARKAANQGVKGEVDKIHLGLLHALWD